MDRTTSTTALRERGTARMRVPADDDRREGQIHASSAPLPERGCTPPERSLVQRQDALKKANGIRSHRAHLKRELKAGEMSPAKVLDDPKCDSMTVIDLLLALPKIGRVKAYKVLREIDMSPSKTLGGMSLRQRGELSRWFRGLPIRSRHTHRAAVVRNKPIAERPDRGLPGLLDDIRSVA